MFHLICFLRQHPAQSVLDSPHIIVLLYFLCRLCLLLNMTSAGAFLLNFKSVPKPIILLCNTNVCLSKWSECSSSKIEKCPFLFSLGYSGSVSLLFSTMCQFYSDVIAVWSTYGGDRQRFFPALMFPSGVIVAANWTTRLQKPAAFQPFLAAPGSFPACQHSCCPKGETLVVFPIITKKNPDFHDMMKVEEKHMVVFINRHVILLIWLKELLRLLRLLH